MSLSQRNSLLISTTDTATNTVKDTSGMSDTTGTVGTIDTDTTTWPSKNQPSRFKKLLLNQSRKLAPSFTIMATEDTDTLDT